MEKIRKIWFWVFLAMFLLPEILWSSILNMTNAILQNNNVTIFFRPNFLMQSDNRSLLLFVLVIQLIGILGLIVQIYRRNFNKYFKILILLVLSSILIITGFVAYLLFYTRNGIGF